MIDAQSRETSIKPMLNRPKVATVIREFKTELKKVSWTTRDELRFFTKIAVGATFTFGLGIYIVDLCIKGGLQLIGKIVYFIFS